MKRLGIFFLLFILTISFTACGSDEIEDKVEKVVEKSDFLADCFDYDIKRVDKSMKEKIGDGEFSLTQYFDYVQISGEGDAVTEINNSIKKDYDSFIERTDEAIYYYNTDSEAQKEASGNHVESTEYINTTDAEIMQNEDNIFSIKYTNKWFVGGVYNEDYIGETFSVKTGKKLNLSEVLGLSHAEAMDRVLKTVEYNIKKKPGDFEENALEYVEEMGIENISFYMEDDDIYLCFKTYEISSGAAGSFIFELMDDDDFYDDEDDDFDDDDDFAENRFDNDDLFYGNYLGKTVSELKSIFGNNYKTQGFEGGLGISFNDQSILFIVGDGYEEVNDDMVARNLIIWDDKDIVEGISAKMTFPELKEEVSAYTNLGEPVYFNNEAEGRWQYNLIFSYNGYSFSYIWINDPNYSESDEVWVSKK